MKDFLGIVLGDTPVGEFLAYLFLSLIGSTAYLYIRVKNRHNTDNGKPEKWSWSFLLKDEADRLLITLIFVYVWASYGHEITGWMKQYINVGDWGSFTYILIGFFTDMIVVYLKKGYQYVGKKVKTAFGKIEKQ